MTASTEDLMKSDELVLRLTSMIIAAEAAILGVEAAIEKAYEKESADRISEMVVDRTVFDARRQTLIEVWEMISREDWPTPE